MGLEKDFGASSLVRILKVFYPRGAAPDKLAWLNEDWAKFKAETKMRSHCGEFTRSLLGWSSDADYPCGAWSKDGI